MNKKLKFLLSLTFLFSIFILTSCASNPTTEITYFKNGKEVECYKNDCKINQDILYCNVFAETGTPPPNYTSSPSDTSSKVTRHSGTITDQSSGSMYSYRGTSRRQTDTMSKGLKSMSNALGNLARRRQYEQRVENRYYECMNIMMGYDLVRVPINAQVNTQTTVDTQDSGCFRTNTYYPDCSTVPEKDYGSPLTSEKDMGKYK